MHSNYEVNFSLLVLEAFLAYFHCEVMVYVGKMGPDILFPYTKIENEITILTNSFASLLSVAD